jgi:glycosyltransferase involved in cell wall biosynthesis
MKILLIRSDVKVAGPAKLMHVCAQELRARGHEVIFATGGGAYLPEIEADGFVHHTVSNLQVNSRNVTSIFSTVLRLSRIIRTNKIDVIHSFNAHAGLLATLADPLLRRKHLNTVLGTGKEWSNKYLIGSKIIAVSQSVRQRLLDAGVSDKRIHVVYNSTLDDRFLAPSPTRGNATGDAGSPVRFCSVAMFTGQKGHEHIIPVLARLVHEKKLNVMATLVGDGATIEACKAMAKDLDIADRLDFVGSQTDVIPFLDGGDIFVHMPHFETFGIVLAEAMARTLPVLAVRVGGIPEVVADNTTGLLLTPSDEDAAVEAAARLVEDPALRHRLGEAGRQRAELFRRTVLGDQLEQLYQS